MHYMRQGLAMMGCYGHPNASDCAALTQALGCATLSLPSDVRVSGWLQTGCPGGLAGVTRRNSNPAFWPVMYQPDRPLGERYTIMRATSLARMYHNTAILTRDGWLLIGGCDACNARTLRNSGGVTTAFWNPSPTGKVSTFIT